MGRTARLLALLALGASLASSVAAAEYAPGQGWPLLDGRLLVGGYATASLTAFDDARDRFAVDDLSLFATARFTDRLRLFAEVELEDLVTVDGDGFHSGSDLVALERLYLEVEPRLDWRLRVGKFLTPFGIWNLVHAAPLVWTTTRPLATEDYFDVATTGASLDVPLLRATHDVTLTLFGQATPHLDDTSHAEESRRGAGYRLQLDLLDGPRIGTSFVHYDDRVDGGAESAVGADFLWPTRLVEWSAEGVWNSVGGGEWSTYLQAVAHTPVALHPFLRLEVVDRRGARDVPVVIGAAWKPTSNTIVKLEGIVGGAGPYGGDGVATSFAVLF